MTVAELLEFAVQSHASDLHLAPGVPPMLRVDGDLRRVNVAALTPEQVHALVFDLMNDQQRKIFEEQKELDFSIDLGVTGRFRANVLQEREGLGAVFRTIPRDIPTFEQLALPPIFRELCDRDKGLVLVTGPTGSGKSTTLAAMIDAINESFAGHIITIEDPVEFVHVSKKCLVRHRELGINTHSFGQALRAALREDPDVILVGELRDLETIQLAITAAETGHLVFGTLHSPGAIQTVDRIIDVFPSGQQAQIRAQFADAFEGVIAQTLFKRRDGKGRVAAFEVLVGVPAARNLIRESKTHQLLSVLQTGHAEGMQTMEAAVAALAQSGLIDRPGVGGHPPAHPSAPHAPVHPVHR